MAEIRKDVVQAGFLEAFSRLIESLDLLNAKHWGLLTWTHNLWKKKAQPFGHYKEKST